MSGLRRRLSVVSRGLTRLPVVLLLAGVVLLIGTPIVTNQLPGQRRNPTVAPPARTGPQAGAAALESAIARAQRRLVDVPKDWSTWAELGSAYVQQGRITGDPSYYSKADGALRRSLELQSTTNWKAMVGTAALANARHDFTAGRDWGRRAEALNPHSGSVHGVLVDALTELGDYDGARIQLQRMLDVEPGVAAFTRASYNFEQRGLVAAARDALNRALAQASSPADRAFCRYYLGELAFHNGDPQLALREYDAGLTADPTYQQLYAGRGKARAALGQSAEALADYARAVQALPLPELLIEYGDLLTAAGKPAQARQQYDLVAAARQLSAVNGISDHLTQATYLADHGQPAEALTEAQAEWSTRRTVLTADALAWALHRNGRDAEALDYSLQATRLGWRNATFYYHRAVIRHALGDREQARDDLSLAMRINPHFDVVQAPIARRLLVSLGGGG
ncbi:tetratricopeptide repeat protein [Micromonospora sp. NPDC005087]|uniref:tetratricopeptide repeat protein n=1 Tax=Micromonospora sp. NPDC005087 TaxID=3364225 RepID=UPI00369D86AE